MKLRLQTDKYEKLARKAWNSTEPLTLYAKKLMYQIENTERRKYLCLKMFLGYIWIFDFHQAGVKKLITIHGQEYNRFLPDKN